MKHYTLKGTKDAPTPALDNFEFLVQGSSAEPYRVRFQRREAGNVSAYCDCAAGVNGQFCKHRVRILRGSNEGVVSDNAGLVMVVAGWLSGTDVEIALNEIVELEQQSEQIKKRLSAAKKVLARALLD